MTALAKAAAIAAGLAALGASGAALAADCDRTCLEGVMETYLDAMVAGDPAALPAARDVRFTENGQEIELGYGLWGGADAIRDYRLYAADPEAGQVALFTVAEEHGAPVLLVVRLEVEAGRITEIEQLAVRQSGLFMPENLVAARPALSQELAPAERRSREEMIAAVDLYFEGLEQNTGAIVPFGPNCERIENGMVTSNPAPGAGESASGNVCTDQFNTGAFAFISRIDPRGYRVIDAERGLVFGFFMFNHEGRETEYVDQNGETRPIMAAGLRPQSVLVAELFRVKAGMIDEIEAVMIGLPYGTKTGWE